MTDDDIEYPFVVSTDGQVPRMRDRFRQAFNIGILRSIVEAHTRANYVVCERSECGEILILFLEEIHISVWQAICREAYDKKPAGISIDAAIPPPDMDTATLEAAWRLGGIDLVRQMIYEARGLTVKVARENYGEEE